MLKYLLFISSILYGFCLLADIDDEIVLGGKSDSDAIITSTYHQPLNITFAKNDVKSYYYSGEYEKSIKQVAGIAMECLDSYQKAERKDKLAVVFSIDECALSTFTYEVNSDFAYNQSTFEEFIATDEETLIKPTLELFNKAKEMGIATFFITNRRSSLKDVTEKNLKRLGYDGWTGISFKPDDQPSVGTRVPYKVEQRQKLYKDGYTIIINLGNQLSDFEGGYAEHCFKYPNPFYYVP